MENSNTKKAGEIESLIDIVSFIQKKFAGVFPFMNLFLLTEKNNKEYLFSSFESIPNFEISAFGESIQIECFWYSVEDREKLKKKEENPELFGTISDAVIEWNSIEESNKNPVIVYNNAKKKDCYSTILKEYCTDLSILLSNIKNVEIYRWGFYIRAENINCFVNFKDDKTPKIPWGVAYFNKEFIWPEKTRDIQCLESFWNKKDEVSLIDDLLISATEENKIDGRDCSFLDI